jgi:hypothetical protein
MSDAINSNERNVIRDLARQVAAIAALPVQNERRLLWRDHNSLRPCRPLFRILPEGSWREILPEQKLICKNPEERRLEWTLRSTIIQHQWRDDGVIDGRIRVAKKIHSTGWGVETKHSDKTEEHGSWAFEPVIKEPEDLKKMRHPVITYDETASKAALQRTQDLLGDILPVELCGAIRPYYHLMAEWTGLRGLEQVMMDMYENPAFLHDAMNFLTEGHQGILKQALQQKLLATNHDGPMVNQGAHGYVDGLPAPGFDPANVRCSDIWALAEAQELAQVSPDQHAEFALTYERKLLEPFSLTCYGCCEDLTNKLEHIVTLPGMRRISISPWSNLERCSERLKGNYIMCWKPQPSFLVGNFDENVIRLDLRSGLESAMRHGCRIDFILKDTHTCENHPERFDRWAAIAREEITRAAEKAGLDAQRAVLQG